MKAAPTTTQGNFSALRGHVTTGQVVIMDDDTRVTILPVMAGWAVTSPQGAPLRVCRSAAELEHEIVRYDGQWV